jgi:hypothetical protein
MTRFTKHYRPTQTRWRQRVLGRCEQSVIVTRRGQSLLLFILDISQRVSFKPLSAISPSNGKWSNFQLGEPSRQFLSQACESQRYPSGYHFHDISSAMTGGCSFDWVPSSLFLHSVAPATLRGLAPDVQLAAVFESPRESLLLRLPG